MSDRYGSESMRHIFSDECRHTTWRALWISLLEAQVRFGVFDDGALTDDLYDHMGDIDYDRVREIERDTHHDVMAHLQAFCEQAPESAPYLHAGATSCFVTDNTDVIMQINALELVDDGLCALLRCMRECMRNARDVVCVGYTHLQPAQPITVGRRIAMWAQDFADDLRDLDYVRSNMRMLGCRGATGTGSAMLELVEGDESILEKIESAAIEGLTGDVCKTFTVSGQTYTRRQDSRVLDVLSGIAQSACKMANDIRFLSSTGEMSEPHYAGQIGSSAMPHKSNPIMCERICSLSRMVIGYASQAAYTAASQFMERTLDDSACRRMYIPEAFIAIDEILYLCEKVMLGMCVHGPAIKETIDRSMHGIMMEPILMRAVFNGGDRQKIHGMLRSIFSKTSSVVEATAMIASDPLIPITLHEIEEILDPEKMAGLSRWQTDCEWHDVSTALHIGS